MPAQWQLDTAGHQRFSGALMSQGLGADSSRTTLQALILMGDWCVPVTRNRTNEDPGAYRRTSTPRAATTVVHKNKNERPTGELCALTRGA